MPKPTLFTKGKLRETGYGDQQSVLDEFIPLNYIMKWFGDRLGRTDSPADRILILKSSTGSGKSTVLPPEFFYRFFNNTGRRTVCCTQPRVINAITIPDQIMQFHKGVGVVKSDFGDRVPLIMGRTIGYQTGEFIKKPVRGILYLQVNILPQQLNVMTPDDFMRKYSVIFIDEVHERSIGVDLAMLKMKKFIEENYKNPKCPFLVLMSATFDSFKFADYFLSSLATKEERYKNIISVEGMSYPIEEHWLPADSQNCAFSIIDTVKKIHIENKSDFGEGSKKLKEDASEIRDILIFVEGLDNISFLKGALGRLNTGDDFFRKFPILPISLSSSVVSEKGIDYKNIYKPYSELVVEVLSSKTQGIEIKKPVRRVIIGTNVAETGITIDTLKYVIDSGLYKSAEFDPNFGIELLIRKPITQGMYKQRRGRCGRKAPGFSYAMYTKKVYSLLMDDQFPDLIKNDISMDILDMIILMIDTDRKVSKNSLKKLQDENFAGEIANKKVDITNFDLLDKPSSDSLHYSIHKLFTLGAINPNIIPTWTGIIMSKFRLQSPESVKMILSGYSWGACIPDLITIASFQNVNRTDIINPKTVELIGKKMSLLAADDFISYVIIWNKFMEEVGAIALDPNLKAIGDWSEKYNIDSNVITDIIEARDNFMRTFSAIGLNPFQNSGGGYKFIGNQLEEQLKYIKKIKLCIFEGYKLNIASLNSVTGKYENLQTHIEFIATRDWISKSKYIIYDKILFKESRKTNNYEGKPNSIGVLDGFVPLDVYFDTID